MTDLDIALPAEWTKKREESQHSAAVVEYQQETPDATTFIVSVMPQTADEGFKLRLSAINRTSTHVRHDYPVDKYDAVEDAVEGAQSFIEMFSQRLQEGSISSAEPEIEAIRETIEAFRGDRVVPSIPVDWAVTSAASVTARLRRVIRVLVLRRRPVHHRLARR